MLRSIVKLTMLFVAAFVVLSASNATHAYTTLLLVDDSRHSLHFARPPQRILSLAPDVTETLFAIGAGAQVIAIDRHSNYPQAALRLPRAGDVFSFNIEAIARLKPDLVVIAEFAHVASIRAQLARINVPLYMSAPRSVGDTVRNIRNLGRITARLAQAESVAQRFRIELEAIETRYKDRVSVPAYFHLWSQPLMVSTDRSVIGEAMRICGIKNLAPAGLTKAAQMQLSIEAAAVADPPHLIVSAGQKSDTVADEKSRNDITQLWSRFLARSPAIQNKHVYTIHADPISRMGPRLVDGVRELCETADRVRGTMLQPQQQPPQPLAQPQTTLPHTKP
jgi:iron complex transport system substrate-binding protein